MKLLIIADTHGDKIFYKEIITKEKADVVIHAGDFDKWEFDGNHKIVDITKEVHHYVLGNHGIGVRKYKDTPTSQLNSQMLRDGYWQDYKIFNIFNHRILLVHIYDFSKRAFGDDLQDVEKFKSEWEDYWTNIIGKNKISYIIQAHTHVAEIKKNKKITIVNPGSLLFPKFPQKVGSYIIANANEKGIKFKIIYL